MRGHRTRASRSGWFPLSLGVGLARLLYTQNPFYVLSTVFVLIGLQQMVAADAQLTGGWVMFGLLCGYTLLLAASAWLIIRFGQVWQDARTILLLLVLLFCAISISFDETTLNSPATGAGFLLMGLGFAIGVSEVVLRGLGIRLALSYRGPYYALLALLFLWPIPLGALSLAGEHQWMSWGVWLFPWAGGLLLLTLLPAARWGRNAKGTSGTPWRWPLYPWSLFAVLWLCLVLRSYSLSMAFERSGAAGTNFAGYFLLPLVISGSLLVWELGMAAGNRKVQFTALLAPLGMLCFVFPSQGSFVQQQFLDQLCTQVASPAQLILISLIGFYGLAIARGYRGCEGVLIALILMLSVVDHRTVSLMTLSGPWTLPWELLALGQIILAISLRKSWRLTLGCLLGIAALTCRFWGPEMIATLATRFYFPLHVGLLWLFMLGLFFNDWAARQIRRVAFVALPLAALLAVLTYDSLFPNVWSWLHLKYVAALVAITVGYWFRQLTEGYLASAVLTLLIWLGGVAKELYLMFGLAWLVDGRQWLLWGLAFLGLALLISFYKGGQLANLRQRWRRMNLRLRAARGLMRRAPSGANS